ncbi:hypothetical protein J2S40_000454 [Nocardioides luteus]|uniref:Sugar ABC transporter ATPase n=1 Tax=Nocardioides luteus TaxID=1844 RepID=A0ABQ5SW20_9ACTN|nr:hypothetical protein [Nocardioides luteus]MDR7309396.1 hypothetical protein [Nocardioides luteus]GGR51001.1 hypothetical protein GCM10010197_16190 [Nocardioides luteus]GLJ67803.1 hypothetical protein GCM10017579_18390 [Nocardioides luteus]
MSERQDELLDNGKDDQTDQADQTSQPEDDQDGGQVSEVQQMGEEGETPISPGDSVAGYPDSESGEADTRGAGPDGIPPENRRDNEFGPAE